MKKVIVAVLALCMVLSLAACGSKTAEYKLGMGVSLNMDSSSSEDHLAQVDATVASVVLDKDGKIVSCRIDCVQDKMDVTDGTVDTAKTFLTKAELKEDYNMVKYSGCTYEWYQQAQAFEAYCVGKTAADISGMELVLNEEGHNVTTDEALYATCSISIEDFIDAVVKACSDDGAATFTAGENFTLGLAAISDASESVAAADAEDGNATVKMYSEFGAVVLDENGKILAAVTDATQPKITVSAEGEIMDTVFNGTKRELKDGYNMVAYGNAIAEWYVQAKAFTDYVAGKTPAEVLAMETTVNEEGNAITTDETLLASCTMSIAGMQNVLALAAQYAR